MKNSKLKKVKKPLTIEQQINRRTFISFGTFTVLSGVAYGGWSWLKNSPKEIRTATAGAKAPLRRALNKTELFFRNFFSNNHLVKTYPKERAAKVVRYNSGIGLKSMIDVEDWQLQVKKQSGEVLNITLDQIKALPKTELIFDFKCVEGWNQISHWGGVKFSDFITHFNLTDQAKLDYVGLATPDKKYYVGIDMPSAMHPQTLLAYEMNDKPLIPKHGEPLRLIIPVKYGIKNLKRIGSMAFSNQRPPDYWAEKGYDYYSGL
ncbi:molybdopterin-binding oxidoreductase [Mucilaginibacter terrigena]|uniref:Molybdopterin-binding oxidoreductase n=2 Tax=Mucilaginibacter terrigena TaxID=2492395 RepID=A0A4Q5LLS4_9SPHI|nr:molybdopterin-binding oxidoreductase [Mucilaginibacter terrigena]